MFEMNDNDIVIAQQYIESVIANGYSMIPTPTNDIVYISKHYHELDVLSKEIYIYGVHLFLRKDPNYFKTIFHVAVMLEQVDYILELRTKISTLRRRLRYFRSVIRKEIKNV